MGAVSNVAKRWGSLALVLAGCSSGLDEVEFGASKIGAETDDMETGGARGTAEKLKDAGSPSAETELTGGGGSVVEPAMVGGAGSNWSNGGAAGGEAPQGGTGGASSMAGAGGESSEGGAGGMLPEGGVGGMLAEGGAGGKADCASVPPTTQKVVTVFQSQLDESDETFLSVALAAELGGTSASDLLALPTRAPPDWLRVAAYLTTDLRLELKAVGGTEEARPSTTVEVHVARKSDICVLMRVGITVDVRP